MKQLKKKFELLPNIFRSIRSLGKWVDRSFRQFLLIAVVLLGFMHYTGWSWDKSEAKRIDSSTPLLAHEDARLIVDTLRQLIAIQRKGKETVVHRGVRKATATKLDSGEIKLDIPTKGFTFEPGLVLGAGKTLRVGGDLQYAYWKRWGLTVGGTVPVHSRRLDLFRGHLGLSYSPYIRWIPNTSVWGGVDTNKSPVFGLRTRF